MSRATPRPVRGLPIVSRRGNIVLRPGKSQNPVTRRGCICPDCANFREYGRQDGYYCADGAAGE